MALSQRQFGPTAEALQQQVARIQVLARQRKLTDKSRERADRYRKAGQLNLLTGNADDSAGAV